VVRTLRAQHRRLIAVVGAIAALVLLATHGGLIVQSVDVAVEAQLGWLALAIVTAVATVPASALCIAGASGQTLPLGRTTAMELAGTFLNRIAPAGLGRAAIAVRFLIGHGLTAERAVSAVAIGSVVSAVAHFGAALMAWALVARAGVKLPHLITTQTLLIAGAVIVAVATALVAVAKLGRGRLCNGAKTRARDLGRDLARLATDPGASARLVGGACAVHLAYLICFVVSLRAAGIHISPAVAALAYFAGTAVADLAPTPGGLGPAEVALAGAVVTVGVKSDLALAGVLIYRLATYWMLSIAGYFSWMALRRKGVLARQPAT
jgi:undecaprenyl-diphosphatase